MPISRGKVLMVIGAAAALGVVLALIYLFPKQGGLNLAQQAGPRNEISAAGTQGIQFTFGGQRPSVGISPGGQPFQPYNPTPAGAGEVTPVGSAFSQAFPRGTAFPANAAGIQPSSSLLPQRAQPFAPSNIQVSPADLASVYGLGPSANLFNSSTLSSALSSVGNLDVDFQKLQSFLGRNSLAFGILPQSLVWQIATASESEALNILSSPTTFQNLLNQQSLSIKSAASSTNVLVRAPLSSSSTATVSVGTSTTENLLLASTQQNEVDVLCSEFLQEIHALASSSNITFAQWLDLLGVSQALLGQNCGSANF